MYQADKPSSGAVIKMLLELHRRPLGFSVARTLLGLRRRKFASLGGPLAEPHLVAKQPAPQPREPSTPTLFTLDGALTPAIT
jgi:hypothetical protein